MTVSEAGKKGGAKRGLTLKGSGNPNSKITAEDAETIRSSQPFCAAETLAKQFGLHPHHIRAIWRGDYW